MWKFNVDDIIVYGVVWMLLYSKQEPCYGKLTTYLSFKLVGNDIVVLTNK